MMRMSLKVLATALLLTSLSTFAAAKKSSEKATRNTASKVNCVPLNQPFTVDYNDGYTLDEVKALRNSIFAQYGYKFTDPEVKAEQVKRGCFKESAKGYHYSNLSSIDKANVKSLKALEAEMSEYTSINFEKEWKKTEGKPKARATLLSGNYCQVTTYGGESYIGLINFSSSKTRDGKGTLKGLFNLKNVKIRVDEDAEIKLDSTSIRAIDATSAASIQYPEKGTWMVDANGDVIVTIGKIAKGASTKLQVTSPEYANTGILSCEFASN